jgi:hypothetical protein
MTVVRACVGGAPKSTVMIDRRNCLVVLQRPMETFEYLRDHPKTIDQLMIHINSEPLLRVLLGMWKYEHSKAQVQVLNAMAIKVLIEHQVTRHFCSEIVPLTHHHHDDTVYNTNVLCLLSTRLWSAICDVLMSRQPKSCTISRF